MQSLKGAEKLKQPLKSTSMGTKTHENNKKKVKNFFKNDFTYEQKIQQEKQIIGQQFSDYQEEYKTPERSRKKNYNSDTIEYSYIHNIPCLKELMLLAQTEDEFVITLKEFQQLFQRLGFMFVDPKEVMEIFAKFGGANNSLPLMNFLRELFTPVNQKQLSANSALENAFKVLFQIFRVISEEQDHFGIENVLKTFKKYFQEVLDMNQILQGFGIYQDSGQTQLKEKQLLEYFFQTFGRILYKIFSSNKFVIQNQEDKLKYFGTVDKLKEISSVSFGQIKFEKTDKQVVEHKINEYLYNYDPPSKGVLKRKSNKKANKWTEVFSYIDQKEAQKFMVNCKVKVCQFKVPVVKVKVTPYQQEQLILVNEVANKAYLINSKEQTFILQSIYQQQQNDLSLQYKGIIDISLQKRGDKNISLKNFNKYYLQITDGFISLYTVKVKDVIDLQYYNIYHSIQDNKIEVIERTQVTKNLAKNISLFNMEEQPIKQKNFIQNIFSKIWTSSKSFVFEAKSNSQKQQWLFCLNFYKNQQILQTQPNYTTMYQSDFESQSQRSLSFVDMDFDDTEDYHDVFNEPSDEQENNSNSNNNYSDSTGNSSNQEQNLYTMQIPFVTMPDQEFLQVDYIPTNYEIKDIDIETIWVKILTQYFITDFPGTLISFGSVLEKMLKQHSSPPPPPQQEKIQFDMTNIQQGNYFTN